MVSRCEWETDRHRRPFTFFAGDGDSATVLLDDLLRADEPDPRPLDTPRVTGAIELLEDVGHVRRRDADARVRDRQHRPCIVPLPFPRDRHGDGTPLGAILAGVGEEVFEHPLETRCIPISLL